MMEQNDAYWDNLGLAWTAIKPDPKVLMPQLRWRLRWQAMLMGGVVFGGVPVGLAGVGLGVWTIWLGSSVGAWHFVIRGVAIVLISTLAVGAAWSFRSALRDHTESLSAMIELALLRAEKWRLAIGLGYVICAIAAVLGLVGYGIRVHFGKPPAMSPIEPLVLLTAIVVILLLCHAAIRERVAKYRYLKRTAELGD